MNILAIETSCDETSIAVIAGDLQTDQPKILSNVVSSQVDIHAQWGGVVPNLAAREHVKNITPVLDESLKKAAISLDQIDLFAVTQGPGLIPALLIGTNAAKTLSYYYQKPLIGIHHVEGHVYANLAQLSADTPVQFPILCLVVSGGHTQLVLMNDHLQYEIIGQTLDDAAGEAFDKVAKIMDLGYPGGPKVSQRAAAAREQLAMIENSELKNLLQNIHFPRPMLNKGELNFSFSGLKTAVLYYYRAIEQTFAPHLASNEVTLEQIKNAICLDFENAVIEVLVAKTLKAAKQTDARTIMLAGGVAANSYLRDQLQKAITKELPDVQYIAPAMELCGDNAGMIGIAAFYRYQHLQNKNQLSQLVENWRTLEADANLKLS